MGKSALLSTAGSVFALMALQPAHAQQADASPDSESAQPDTDVVVVGTPPARYNAEAAEGVTGFDVPALNLPRVVVGLPEQILLDQQITQLDEALKNVSSVSRGQGFGATYDDLFSRGFRAVVIYRDGKRITFNQRNPTTQIERVEVLKGPGSMLFSAIEPGGAINIVTKKPQAEPRHFLNVLLDEYGKRYLLADLTGPLDAGGSLLYRVAASYENSDTFRDHKDVKRLVISPSLTWQPTDRDSLRLAYSYVDETLPIDRGAIVGTFADGSRRIIELPQSRDLGEPWQTNKMKGHNFDAQYDRTISDDWKFSIGYGYQNSKAKDLQLTYWDYYAEDTVIGGRSVAAGTLTRQVAANPQFDIASHQLNFRLTGKFDVAGMPYTLQFGGDGANIHQQTAEQQGFNETANIRSGGALFNVFAPVYGLTAPTGLELSRTSEDRNKYRGLYAQNMLEPAPGVFLIAGVRHDWFRVNSSSQRYDEGVPDRPPVSANRLWQGWSYQLGASYEFVKGLALYADRSTSLNVHPFFNYDPEAAPMRGTQWEAGLKGDILDKRLQFSINYFSITQTNIPTLNPDYDGTNNRYAFIGAARSRGVDLDLTVRLAEGMNVIASYSNFKYRVIEDGDPALQGKTSGNVAPRSFNIWGSYELKRGPARGLGFGTGLNHVAERFGDDENTWVLPAYTLWDAAAWYYLRVGDDQTVRLQVSAKNITNERWYVASDGDPFAPGAIVGQPRTFLFSAAYQF